MRTIKFRAWYPPVTEQGIGTMSEEVFLNDGDLFLNNQLQDIKEGGTLIIQFTGLKDINGKEIYEDDLIQHVADGNEPRKVYRIQWNGTEVRFQAWRQFEYFDLDIHVIENYKIVGNFHETPELLNIGK